MVNTEWADDSGEWLFSFKNSHTISLTYTIISARHSFKFDLEYHKDGQKVVIDDCLTGAHGAKFTVLKDFQGTLSDNSEIMTADFENLPTKVKDKDTKLDFSKTESIRVILKKK